MMPLAQLLRMKHHRNPKLHNHVDLASSFRRFGFTAPPTIDETTQILVAGHGRCETLEMMREAGQPPPDRIELGADGGWMVPVIRGVSFKSDRDRDAYLVADNQIPIGAGWNRDALSDLLSDLADDDDDGEALTGLGFEQDELAELLAEPSDDDDAGGSDGSAGKEVPVGEHTRTIGGHKVRPPAQMTNEDWRLHLGDCVEGMKAKVPDASIDAVVTDPPAGISFMGRDWDSDKGGKEYPRGFGPWLAGFADGESNFDIHKQNRDGKDYYYCRFEISLRADDGGVLEMLKKHLGGKVYYGETSSQNGNANPKGRWEMVAREECVRLATLFDRFPLQSKKARDFAIWREALKVSCDHAGTSRPDLMAPFWEQLRGTRPYAGKATDASVFKEMAAEHGWIEWLRTVMAEAYRALKPGGHLLAWALPRTSHWTMLAIEQAGFEIRDVVYHAFGTGFPKNLDVSKAIDAKLGAERDVVGEQVAFNKLPLSDMKERATAPLLGGPATPEAQKWDGWGTALKPAVEPWILARKPLEGTVAENVLKYGTGAINIDECRIGGEQRFNPSASSIYSQGEKPMDDAGGRPAVGRWPAHLVLTHAPECRKVGVEEDTRNVHVGEKLRPSLSEDWGMGRMATEPVTILRDKYECVPGCPVRIIDEQSGISPPHPGGVREHTSSFGIINDDGWQPHGSTYIQPDEGGGASRFFYVAKPSKAETEAGLGALPELSGGELTDRKDGSKGLENPRAGAGRGGGRRNIHPTKKPIELMRYLVRLITPRGGIVLDPFTGSGTTGLASLVEGCRFVGFEMSAEYHAIASERMRTIIEDPRSIDDADGAAEPETGSAPDSEG